MKIKYGVFAALALITLACVCMLSGCNTGKTECVLQAENAVIEPEYDEDVAAVVRANSRSENITDGGKYAGKLFAGASVTWFFTAERQADCTIKLAVANADENSAGFAVGGGMIFSISFNGAEVILPEYEIAAGTPYGDSWQVLNLGTFRARTGINKLTYTALSDGERLNLDYVALDSKRADIKEHTHFWKNSSAPANCTDDGYITKSCADCGYEYTGGVIRALGHKYGNFHYHHELMKMVSVCDRCGDTVTANTPDSKYFGEVYYEDCDFVVRPDEILYEAEDAFVCLDGGLNNGNSYIKKDNGKCNDPSGGKLVENISKVGNYIMFRVDAQENCTADLVFRMSNTMYSTSGIAELNPMSDYVFCTVNGDGVDFSFVSFPGFATHSYFEWRYVVVKDVQLNAGENIIEIGPKDNAKHKITMPNTDVLKIYTDGADIKAVKFYNINDVTAGEYTDGGYALPFAKGDGFTLYAGVAAPQANYVVKVFARSPEDCDGKWSLFVNDSTVNLENVKLTEGENTVVLKDVPVRALKNTVTYEAEEGVKVTSVAVYTESYLPAAYDCAIKPENDYIKSEGAKKPALVFEAEKADLGDSVSSRDGVDLIELNIYENTGKPASGNSAIGNFSAVGNKIVWRFESSEEADAEITLMLASANFSAELNGNALTDKLQTRIVVTINGIAAVLDEIVLSVDSVANYYDWKAVTVSCKIVGGENEVCIEALSYGAPNMDVLYVYADGTTLSPIP